MGDIPLPEPESAELEALLSSSALRMMYGLLYRRHENPPTMAEVRLFMATALGEDQVHFDRRMRQLRDHFDVPAIQDGRTFRYPLRGWAATQVSQRPAISSRLRAEVLAPQRCAQCGRSPLGHGVVLVVDHKLPKSWGGTNDAENLQPLCEACNAGKRDYFRTHEAHAELIQQAANYHEPQRRIGELLRAFRGGWVRTDLLCIVASAKEYQEDWQRRLRDLRFLGWEIQSRRSYDEGARVWTYYRAVRTQPWPDNIRAAITSEERRRSEARRGQSDRAEEPT